MKFEEALVELRKGKKIKLPSWKKYWLELFNENIIKISLEEILSECWEIVEEPGKTFPEVFEAFNKGKKIRRKDWIRDPREHGNLMKSDGGKKIYIFDLLATDWEIID